MLGVVRGLTEKRYLSTIHVCLHFLTLSEKHIQDPVFTRQLFDCQYRINISGLIHFSFVKIPFPPESWEYCEAKFLNRSSVIITVSYLLVLGG